MYILNDVHMHIIMYIVNDVHVHIIMYIVNDVVNDFHVHVIMNIMNDVFGWILRRTKTIKVIWRVSSFTGGGSPLVPLRALFQARAAT